MSRMGHIVCGDCGFSAPKNMTRNENGVRLCLWCLRDEWLLNEVASDGSAAVESKTFAGPATYKPYKFTGKPAYKAPIISCQHNMTALPLPELGPDLMIYATGRAHAMTLKAGEEPTAGLYLDSSWLGTGQLLTNFDCGRGAPRMELAYINWPDMNAVALATLHQAVRLLRIWMFNGKRVEVGCMGGHGRTGTVLTALLLASAPHLSASAAILEIRARYCKKAVEGEKQANLLHDYSGYLALLETKKA